MRSFAPEFTRSFHRTKVIIRNVLKLLLASIARAEHFAEGDSENRYSYPTRPAADSVTTGNALEAVRLEASTSAMILC